ncbi:hypothetical protein F4604DRAFT_1200773 [Suillus subluteus]|nr:hypothetical protein F4604DRAFT_1200773 [Suillus subluteus]
MFGECDLYIRTVSRLTSQIIADKFVLADKDSGIAPTIQCDTTAHGYCDVPSTLTPDQHKVKSLRWPYIHFGSNAHDCLQVSHDGSDADFISRSSNVLMIICGVFNLHCANLKPDIAITSSLSSLAKLVQIHFPSLYRKSLPGFLRARLLPWTPPAPRRPPTPFLAQRSRKKGRQWHIEGATVFLFFLVSPRD